MKDVLTIRDPNVVIIHYPLDQSSIAHPAIVGREHYTRVGQHPAGVNQVTLFDSVITSNEVIDEVDSQCYCVLLCGAIYDFFCFG
jgi:hypothetical protein